MKMSNNIKHFDASKKITYQFKPDSEILRTFTYIYEQHGIQLSLSSTIRMTNEWNMYYSTKQKASALDQNRLKDQNSIVIKTRKLKYLMFGKTFTNGPGLFGTKVKRQVLLVLISFSQCCLLLLWYHSQYLCYWQPHHLTESNHISFQTITLSITKKKKNSQFTVTIYIFTTSLLGNIFD